MNKTDRVSILFVCLGNICRSPTAHGVFQTLVDHADLAQQVIVDSCGTGDWHIGDAPDPRTIQKASTYGYDLSALRARQVDKADFEDFDIILAMDKQNLKDLQTLRPRHSDAVLDLFLPFCQITGIIETPDPYHGGEESFEHVIQLVEQASKNLLAIIQREYLSTSS